MEALPPDEPGRLAALHALNILDTAPEEIYDDLVTLAAAICDVPIAVINFVDADRQWGKALVGLESSECPREVSFCARTIVQRDGLLIVPDTHADPQWSSNPQVLGDPRLRFYAGAALVTDAGHAVGSICVADREPRTLGPRQLDALRALARQAVAHLRLRERSNELVRANRQLQRMATRDPLTRLANRVLLEETAALELGRRARTGAKLGLLFCDVDSFKPINDTLGHAAGDVVLIAIARRLAGAARASDLVARVAGDEFVVLCPDLASSEDLELISSRLAAQVARPLTVAATQVIPRLSIGTTLARDGDTIAEMIKRADEAMYAVKARRRREPEPDGARVPV